ncbi:hypothetical protein CYY_002196 [Polysphondylium violaceum]|uniref:ADF-H domain-containing protein n=1 Tax=Polysphondylium violaceum TaxID=133409 RepID=A0A8J4PX75_9MYCE|nr:hypothetical protein CYY_002196 [Polysphondylium violaceum]
MSSGVTVNPQTIEVFNQLKLGKQCNCIFYKLNDDDSEIVIEKVLPNSTTFEQVVNELPPNDCRYVVYDYDYEIENEGKRNKIFFINWCPYSTPIKNKMIFTSSKESIRRPLVGIHAEIQSTDYSELSKDILNAKCC